MENKTVIHSLWISGPLQKINLLTIKSFLDKGHEFHLYAYNAHDILHYHLMECKGLSLLDAHEVLPESEIYYYKKMQGGNPNFKFGGIAERLKAEMLYQLGSWHVDLDVTCLKSFDDLNDEYVLRPHEKGVVGNIIKAPKHSELARRYIEHTKTIDENNTHWEKSFLGLNQIVKDLQLEKYVLSANVLGDDSDKYYKDFLKAGIVPEKELHAIHWCAARDLQYEKGSFYESLLNKYSLL